MIGNYLQIRFLYSISSYELTLASYFARIGRQNEMISNAHRSVLESEEVGMEITSELARNREKIESSRAKVHVTTVDLLTSIGYKRQHRLYYRNFMSQ